MFVGFKLVLVDNETVSPGTGKVLVFYYSTIFDKRWKFHISSHTWLSVSKTELSARVWTIL